MPYQPVKKRGKAMARSNYALPRVWAESIRDAVGKLAPDGRPWMTHIAEKLVQLAASGDMYAIKEVGERTDGKVQSTDGGEGGLTITLNFKRDRDEIPREFIDGEVEEGVTAASLRLLEGGDSDK